MRPIKFRVRGAVDNTVIGFEMIKNNSWYASAKGQDWENGTYTGKIQREEFTGFLDKNGKEIYEGDIILIPDTYTIPITDDGCGPEEDYNHLLKVEFKDGTFGAEVPEKEEGMSSGWWPWGMLTEDYDQSTFEVIGNIWENPELVRNNNV